MNQQVDLTTKLGILGGGQLGRMLIQEAVNFNIHISVLDPAVNAPCADLANNFVVGNLIKNILDKKNLKINANHNVIRSYMHESDLSSWLLKIVKNSDIKCPIYNVGSDDAVNISNLAYLLSKKFKLKTTLKKKRSSFHDKYIPSIQKAKTELKLRLKYDSLSSVNRVIYSIKKNTYL